MIRKKIILLLISLLLVQGLFSQIDPSSNDVLNLSALGDDLDIIANDIGTQLTPNLEQVALSGDIVGEAEMGDFPSFSMYFPISAGVTVYDGLAKDLYDDDTEWNFVVPISNLVETILGNMGDMVGNIYSLGGQAMVVPAVNVGFGTGLVNGFEFFAEGMYLPGSVVSTENPVIPIDEPRASIDQKFIRTKLRKVLIHDKGFSPAVSLGIGYNYLSTNLHAGIDSFGDENIEMMGLYLNGNMDIGLLTSVHGFGMDLHISKRLLLFTPYIKISPYYSLANYNLDLAMNADLYLDSSPSGKPIKAEKLKGHGGSVIHDLNLYTTVGNEIKLGFLILNTNVLLNTQRFAFQLGNLLDSLDNLDNLDPQSVNLDGFSVNIGLRMQFPLTGKMRDRVEK